MNRNDVDPERSDDLEAATEAAGACQSHTEDSAPSIAEEPGPEGDTSTEEPPDAPLDERTGRQSDTADEETPESPTESGREEEATDDAPAVPIEDDGETTGEGSEHLPAESSDSDTATGLGREDNTGAQVQSRDHVEDGTAGEDGCQPNIEEETASPLESEIEDEDSEGPTAVNEEPEASR